MLGLRFFVCARCETVVSDPEEPSRCSRCERDSLEEITNTLDDHTYFAPTVDRRR